MLPATLDSLFYVTWECLWDCLKANVPKRWGQQADRASILVWWREQTVAVRMTFVHYRPLLHDLNNAPDAQVSLIEPFIIPSDLLAQYANALFRGKVLSCSTPRLL